jgi:hypothetical protein
MRNLAACNGSNSGCLDGRHSSLSVDVINSISKALPSA